MSLKTVSLITLPILTWSYFFYTWYKIKAKEKIDSIYNKKNNCVITYANNREMWGWLEQGNIASIKSNFQPLLNFINTATKSLDIAMMTFSVNTLIDALNNANLRGVKIRIIVDSSDCIHKLKRCKVSEIKCCHKIRNTDNIFHNKYIIRDYDEDTCAVLNGSLNFTVQGIFNNYEDVVITTDVKVVKAFKYNFDELWKHFPSND